MVLVKQKEMRNKDGRIIESGSHGNLMSADGEYAQMFKLQAQLL